jgi:hypothetical protein
MLLLVQQHPPQHTIESGVTTNLLGGPGDWIGECKAKVSCSFPSSKDSLDRLTGLRETKRALCHCCIYIWSMLNNRVVPTYNFFLNRRNDIFVFDPCPQNMIKERIDEGSGNISKMCHASNKNEVREKNIYRTFKADMVSNAERTKH